ncbi:MAG: hypothetical protein JWM25_2022 [Thermoleophilia bacterium]|nr:hypothetical protein [Thermoleophilia bacterium]MCZ4497437.1 hypothetical protein [Thermoleophilia bacterium]
MSGIAPSTFIRTFAIGTGVAVGVAAGGVSASAVKTARDPDASDFAKQVPVIQGALAGIGLIGGTGLVLRASARDPFMAIAAAVVGIGALGTAVGLGVGNVI